MSYRNISSAELGRIARICERVHYTVSKEAFTNHLYVVMGEAVPSVHFTIDRFSLAPLTLEEAVNQSLPETTFEGFRRYMHQHPGLIRYGALNQCVGSLLTELKPSHYRNTELYNEVYRPVDIEDQVWFGAGDKEELIAVSYSRDATYTEKELHMLSFVQPQIHIAWQNWKRIRSLEKRLQALEESQIRSERQALEVAAKQTAFESLTRRQREVADLVASGKTNMEIADELRISPRTVEKHVEQIFTTLNIHTRIALAQTVHHRN